MKARLFKPAKTAMQSGKAGTARWMLEFEPTAPSLPNPLTGWGASGDTGRQVRMFFPDRESAEAFARERGLSCELREPAVRRIRPKSYAANFTHDRRAPWTH